jgi:hypothetical protein
MTGASPDQPAGRLARPRRKIKKLALLATVMLLIATPAAAYYTTGIPLGTTRVFAITSSVELNATLNASSPRPLRIWPATPQVSLEHCPTARIDGGNLAVYGTTLPVGTSAIAFLGFTSYPAERTGGSRWDPIIQGQNLSVRASLDTTRELYTLWNDNGPRTSTSVLQFEYDVIDMQDGSRPYRAFENHTMHDLGTFTVLARPGFLCM